MPWIHLSQYKAEAKRSENPSNWCGRRRKHSPHSQTPHRKGIIYGCTCRQTFSLNKQSDIVYAKCYEKFLWAHLNFYTFQEHFTAFPTCRKLKRVEHMLGILFNITSEMTSYIPTCWKQSFVLLNITFKILHISRALFSFAHRWKTRIMHGILFYVTSVIFQHVGNAC